MNIGITLTSSLHVGQEYIDLTRAVVSDIAARGHGIVYGGTEYGMMKELAQSYKDAGGTKLIGVMAEDLMTVTKGYKAFEGLDERHVEPTMGARIAKITSLSDALLILPGGYGTVEELTAMIGGKVNKLHTKPIAILNIKGFYNTLITFLTELFEKQFSKVQLRDIVFIGTDIDAALDYFDAYQSDDVPDKFIG
jgi:hypothetical protein